MRFLSFVIVFIAIYGCSITWSLPLESAESSARNVAVETPAAPNNLEDLADVGAEHSNDGDRNARLIGFGIGFGGFRYRPYYGGWGYGGPYGWGYGRPFYGYYGGPWGYGGGYHHYYWG